MRDLDSMTVLAGAVNVWPPTLMEPPPSTMIDASGDAAGGKGESDMDVRAGRAR